MTCGSSTVFADVKQSVDVEDLKNGFLELNARSDGCVGCLVGSFGLYWNRRKI